MIERGEEGGGEVEEDGWITLDELMGDPVHLL